MSTYRFSQLESASPALSAALGMEGGGGIPSPPNHTHPPRSTGDIALYRTHQPAAHLMAVYQSIATRRLPGDRPVGRLGRAVG